MLVDDERAIVLLRTRFEYHGKAPCEKTPRVEPRFQVKSNKLLQEAESFPDRCLHRRLSVVDALWRCKLVRTTFQRTSAVLVNAHGEGSRTLYQL